MIRARESPTQRIPLAALLLVALCPAAAEAGQERVSGETSSPAPSVSLAEVRSLFGRVDADRSGRLSVREADHAGIAAPDLKRYDGDGDGELDPGEFVVAQHGRVLAGKRRAAPDLEAESTRIQALRRARVARREGPSPAPQRSRSLPLAEAATDAGAGPGLGRLRQAAGRTALRRGPGAGYAQATLEDRAQAAQELIQLRLERRSSTLARRAPDPAPKPRAPGSRVRLPVGDLPPASQSARALAAPGATRAGAPDSRPAARPAQPVAQPPAGAATSRPEGPPAKKAAPTRPPASRPPDGQSRRGGGGG